MAKTIEPRLCKIKDYTKLSGGEKFHIPVYQRGYSWTIEQCEKLWQDIETFIASGANDPYFFGTVIIDCSNPAYRSLIDGQQRTTTFLLLVKALQLRIKEILAIMPADSDALSLKRGLENSYKTTLDILYTVEDDDDLLVKIEEDWNTVHEITILENESMNESYPNEFKKIIDAETYEDAKGKVETIAYKQKDNRYTNFFRNFKFFYENLKTYSDSQVNNFAKIFLSKCEIIEIRSWNLEQAITMFNSLNSTGMPLSDADIISARLYAGARDKENFKEKWMSIIERAEKLDKIKVLNLDSVLQQYMYNERAKSKQYKEGNVTTPGVRRYYITDHSELLKEPEKLCDSFDKILEIWNEITDYPVIKLLLRFNENFKLFLIPYLLRYNLENITPERVTPVVESLIKLFALLELGDKGFSASEFKTFLFNENLKMVDPEISEEDIVADFSSHISNKWNRNDVEQALMKYDKNTLVFLNEYLYAKENGLGFDFQPTVNVEHIMPSSGRNLASIRKDAGVTDTEFKTLANLLGNKILLEEDINKSISNDWFITKKGNSVESKRGYKNSKFGIAKYLASYPKDQWQKEDIISHTEVAQKRISDFIFG